MNKKLNACLFMLVLLIQPCGADNALFYNNTDPGKISMYFSRADSELNSEAWLKTADAFIAIAPEWEQDYLKKILIKRFSDWNWSRIHSDFDVPSFENLLNEINKLNRQYLFAGDSNEIMYDKAGDPEMLKLEDFAKDSLEWNTQAEKYAEKLYASWEKNLSIKYDELITDEKYDNEVIKEMNVNLSEYRNRIRKELEIILIEEEKNFIKKRCRDIYSLKRDSESEGAAEKLKELSRITEEISSDSFSNLDEKYDAINESEEYNLTLKSLDWEKTFKEEFENGLNRWSKAEQMFIENRINWELDAENKYRESEEKWDNVFSKLEESKTLWQQKMINTAEEGMEKWIDRDNSFMDSFLKTLNALQKAADKEIRKLEIETSSLLAVYRESKNVEVMALENIEYLAEEIRLIYNYKDEKKALINIYQAEINKKYDAIASLEKTINNYDSYNNDDDDRRGFFNNNYLNKLLAQKRIDEINEEIKPIKIKLEKMITDEKKKDNELLTYKNEHEFWKSTALEYSSLRKKAEEDLLGLEKTSGEISTFNKSYSLELARLIDRKEILYRELIIAENLLAYFLDESSERDKKNETIEKYETAIAQYDLSENIYMEKLHELEKFLDTEIALCEKNITISKEVLETADKNLELARNEYESRLSIYKIKESSLIESKIADIKTSLEYYNNSGRIDAFEEYFHAAEGFDRRDIQIKTDMLIDDLKGLSEIDYYTDIPKIEKMTADAESIVLDINTLSVESLKTFMILNSLNKTKEYNNLIASYEKACISSGEEYSQAITVAEKYLNDMRNNLFYDLSYSTAMLELFEDADKYCLEEYVKKQEKLHDEISALENYQNHKDDINSLSKKKAELEVFEKYAFSALSYAAAMAEKRGMELKNILGYSEEADTFNLLSGAVDSSEYINFFKQLYSINNLPDYIEKAVKKYLSVKMHIDGVLYNPGTDIEELQNEYNLLTLDENNSEDESESLKMLSIEIEALRAVYEICSNEVITGTDLYYEKDSLEKILSSAVKISEKYDIEHVNLENAEASALTASNLESDAGSKKDLLKSLEKELSEWDKNQKEYFENNIASYKSVFENKKEASQKARLSYLEALNEYNRNAAIFAEKNIIVSKLFKLYEEAGFSLDSAEEIMDFALSPYELKESNPNMIYAQRKREYDKAEELLSLFESLKNNSNEDFMKTGDEILVNHVLDLKETAGFFNYMQNNIDLLERKIELLTETAGRNYRNIIEEMSSLFVYETAFCPDFNRTISDLSDFTDVEESNIEKELSQYFSMDNSSMIYSSDTFIWAVEIDRYGNSLIRDFGIAYYHEFGTTQNINVPVYSDQYYNSLVTDDSNYKKASVECDPEKYVENTAANVYNRIKSDGYLFKLYSFFRIMKKGNKTSFNDSFIGEDISQLAHDYLAGKAKEKESNIKKSHWWSNFWNRTANKIKTKRKNMTDVDGSEERKIILTGIKSAIDYKLKYNKVTDDIACLLGGDGSLLTLESLVKAFDMVNKVSERSYSDMGEGFYNTLSEFFSQLRPEYKANAVDAASAIAKMFYEQLSEIEEKIYLRKNILAAERNKELINWKNKSYNYDIFNEEIIQIAEKLFMSPEYTEKDLSSLLVYQINTAESHSLSGREFILQKAGAATIDLYRSIYSTEIEGRLNELRLAYEKMLREKENWIKGMKELIGEGERHWNKSQELLVLERNKWRSEYFSIYDAKKELFENNYSLLKDNKNLWLENTAAQSMREQNIRTAREAGISADILISETERIIIPQMRINSESLDSVVSRAFNRKEFKQIIDAAQYLSAKENRSAAKIAALLPQIRQVLDHRETGEAYDKELAENVRKRIMFLTALAMKKSVGLVHEEITNKIDKANKNVSAAMKDMLEGKGYKHKGLYFTRNAVIDMSLFGGIEQEIQRIKEYRYFESPVFTADNNLDDASLKADSSGMIELKVEKAIRDLKKYSQLVFGTVSSENTDQWYDFDQEFLAKVKSAESAFMKSGQYSSNKEAKGLFAYHLGYLPVMESNNPEKIRKKGYGEYGRIFELYLINEGRLGRGLSSLDVPWYSQKMWDDDSNNDGQSDGILGAPSVRSAAGLALSVITGGGLSGIIPFLTNMADDILFTAMDVSGNITDWKDGALSIAKQAGSGLVTSSAGSLVPEGLLESDNFIVSGLSASSRRAAENMAAASVNSLELSSEGIYLNGSSFKKELNNNLTGINALSGYISTGGSSALNSTLTGFYGSSLHDGRALSSLAAGSAAGVFEYVYSGKTSLNILNSADFGYGSTGLMELRAGGKGSLLNLGSEGLNASSQALAASVRGAAIFKENAAIAFSGKENVRDSGIAMRVLYSAGKEGDEAADKTFYNLLSGRDRLVFEEGAGNAETLYEEKREGRTIRITDPGSERMSRLQAGVFLVHEAHRDGYDNDELQTAETISAVRGHAKAAYGIGKDYKGFFESSPHLAAEAHLYDLSENNRQQRLFDGYAQSAYRNKGGDYYFPDFEDFGLKQDSDAGNRDITLGYDEAGINTERLYSQYKRYLSDINQDTEKLSFAKFQKLREKDETFAKKYNFDIYKNESLAQSGCNLYTLLYIQQTLTGVPVSGKDANNILKKNNQYAEGNLLYTDSSKALEILTQGEYSFDFTSLHSSKNTNAEIIQRLLQAKTSDSIESVRVYDGKHFVLLKDFNTETDVNGKQKISSIEILNPLKNTRTSYSYEEIKRWDFFTAVKNISVQNNPYQFAFIPSSGKYDRRASLWDY